MVELAHTVARQGGAAMRTQTAVGVLLLALVILVAAGIQVIRLNG